MPGSRSPSTRSSLGSLLPWVAPLVAALGTLALVADPVRHPWLAVSLLILGWAAFAVAVWRLEERLTLASVLGIAAVLRLVLIPMPASLSDDTLRYIWDGRVAASGANPYLLAPEDESLAPLRDDAWQVMPHKHVPTVYPPLALLLFTGAGLTPAPFTFLKIILAFADLLGCWLLVRLAERLGFAPGRAAWYAWNPLVILEIAGQGHVDGLMVPLMILAVYLLVRPVRAGWAGAAAAAAALSKLVPLLALAVWARGLVGGVPTRSGCLRAARFLGAAGLLSAACLLPVVVSVGGVPPGLVAYGVSWEFNGAFYEPLWRVIDALDPIDEVKAGLDRLKDLTGFHDLWNRLYPLVYPQMLAKLILAAGLGIFFMWELRERRHPVVASSRIFGAVLLAVSTVYPWYALWTLPWAALGRRRAWLVLSGLLPLSYLPQHTEVPLFPWIWAIIWVPFFLLLWRQPPWPLDAEESLREARR